MSASTVLPAVSPVAAGVRMFVAPVVRMYSYVPVFDPAALSGFTLSAPPAPWIDAGSVLDFHREDTSTVIEVFSGTPATLKTRARTRSAAAVHCSFPAWSKLAMALSSGSQQMNLLSESLGASPDEGGGTAVPAVSLLPGSTAAVLQVPAAMPVSAGDIVVVDDDYAATTGAVGAGAAGAWVAQPSLIGAGADYTRRVSFNVARVRSVAAAANGAVPVTLAAPLLAGVPTATMKLQKLAGFADRIGGSFLQEWSALFVFDGLQGDRVLLHYPRLQTLPGVSEQGGELAPGLERWRLTAKFTALPVTDPNDGEPIVCVRSYLPAPMRTL